MSKKVKKPELEVEDVEKEESFISDTPSLRELEEGSDVLPAELEEQFKELKILLEDEPPIEEILKDVIPTEIYGEEPPKKKKGKKKKAPKEGTDVSPKKEPTSIEPHFAIGEESVKAANELSDTLQRLAMILGLSKDAEVINVILARQGLTKLSEEEINTIIDEKVDLLYTKFTKDEIKEKLGDKINEIEQEVTPLGEETVEDKIKGRIRNAFTELYTKLESESITEIMQRISKHVGMNMARTIIDITLEEPDEPTEPKEFQKMREEVEEERRKRIKRRDLIRLGERLPRKVVHPPKRVPVSGKIPPRKRGFMIFDYYTTKVTKEMRTMIREMYKDILSTLLSKKQITKKEIVKKRTKEEIEKEYLAYEDSEFDKWLQMKYWEDLNEELKAVEPQIQEEIESRMDVGTLLDELNSLFADNNFTLHTAGEIEEALEKQPALSTFQGTVLSSIRRIPRDTKDRDLALEITDIIDRYLKTVRSEEEIYKIVRQEFFREIFQKLKEDFRTNPEGDLLAKERQRFKKEHGETLRKLFEEYTKQEEAVQVVEEEKTIPPPREKLSEEVGKFEKIIYEKSRKAVLPYLSFVLTPYLFLSGGLSQYANFFNANIRSGRFSFSKLDKANTAYYFPEALMGGVTKEKIKTLSDIIYTTLMRDVDSFLLRYHKFKYPAFRIPMSLQSYYDITLLRELVVKPQDICNAIREAEDENENPLITEDGKQIMEEIPDEDLVICLMENKFACYSLRNLLRQFARKDYIDPQTKKRYPKSLIKNLHKAYDIKEKKEKKKKPKVYVPPRKVHPSKSPEKVVQKELKRKPVEHMQEVIFDVHSSALFKEFYIFNDIEIVGKDRDYIVPLTNNFDSPTAQVILTSVEVAKKSLKKLKRALKKKGTRAVYVFVITSPDTTSKDINEKIREVKELGVKDKNIITIVDASDFMNKVLMLPDVFIPASPKKSPLLVSKSPEKKKSSPNSRKKHPARKPSPEEQKLKQERLLKQKLQRKKKYSKETRKA